MLTQQEFLDELGDALRASVDGLEVPPNFVQKLSSRHQHVVRTRIKALSVVSASIAAAIVLIATLGNFTVQQPTKRVVLPSVAKPHGHQTSPVKAILDRVAHVAATAPVGLTPGAGQYLYVDTTKLNTFGTGVGDGETVHYQIVEDNQEWISPLGGGHILETPKSVSFVTPADQQAWEQFENSPTAQKDIQIWRENGNSGDPGLLGKPFDRSYPPSSPGKCAPLFDDFCPVPDVADLPTDPSSLETAIVQKYEHGVSDPQLTFQFVGGLLDEVASPQLRAALYEMIEQLPGVTNMGPMTDQLGRSGEAVGLTEYGSQHQLIFDPTTSKVLEETVVQVSSQTYSMGLPIGTVSKYTVYVGTGIADSSSQVPHGSVEPSNTGNSGSKNS